MLKKTLLSALFTVSTIATAQVSLDLNLTIKNPITERNASGTVIVEENVPATIVFDGLEALAFEVVANQESDDLTVQVQVFQITENENLVEITNPLAVRVPFGQPATITVNEESADEENNGSLVLVITPSLVE